MIIYSFRLFFAMSYVSVEPALFIFVCSIQFVNGLRYDVTMYQLGEFMKQQLFNLIRKRELNYQPDYAVAFFTTLSSFLLCCFHFGSLFLHLLLLVM